MMVIASMEFIILYSSMEAIARQRISGGIDRKISVMRMIIVSIFVPW